MFVSECKNIWRENVEWLLVGFDTNKNWRMIVDEITDEI